MIYQQRLTSITVVPEGRPLFDELATRVSIVDEGGGEFLVIEQGAGNIRVGPIEWPAVRRAIDTMIESVATAPQPTVLAIEERAA